MSLSDAEQVRDYRADKKEATPLSLTHHPCFFPGREAVSGLSVEVAGKPIS